MVGSRPAAALLVLSDGEAFEGFAGPALSVGRVASGEIVFNTVMAGYQEVLTDPSYAGQVLAFTYPHIGNYGTSPEDSEAARPACRGVVVREMTGQPSSWRSTSSLPAFLEHHDVPAITGIDTRRLTRHIRQAGSMTCAFGQVDGPGQAGASGGAGYDALLAAARAEPGTAGVDLVASVTTKEPYTIGRDEQGGGDGDASRLRVVAYDFGAKASSLRLLARHAEVHVVPAHTSASEVLEERPDGVFLSNGPGDPALLGYATDAVAALLGRVPVFGICLGHQLLAQSLGGRTYKLAFGHHGGNHPVRDAATGSIEITSQNHNFAVDASSVEGAVVTHVNLNDGVVEGIEVKAASAFGIQYHPEAAPGPRESRYLFSRFLEMIQSR
ncbi:MAG: glutamine-hydrolyzing carbamoyl-phosphate synthase small subunit [Acidimicrobiales bacterium]